MLYAEGDIKSGSQFKMGKRQVKEKERWRKKTS
jgi:hypothetical protein